MQAIGLSLEENGTVLALREEGHTPGAKWDVVPASILGRLDTAAKVRSTSGGWRPRCQDHKSIC